MAGSKLKRRSKSFAQLTFIHLLTFRIPVPLQAGGPTAPALKDSHDPNFPQLDCVNGSWGKAWTEGLALAAAYDFAGISLVPDEYNWFYSGYEESYGKHPDPVVAEYYKNLPAMCACPVCQKLYQGQFGAPLPKLAKGETFPDQTQPYLNYLKHRYDSATGWLARSAAAVHAANPAIRADSLLCVTPICSDFWWGPGIAWDRLGETGMDFPTTDPYIQLHNYLGDSTHWYVTETAAHLTGSTPKRQCGIVLEASRLQPEFREMDPVEIYGSALSAVCHGAKELAWWHYSHLTDETPVTAHADVSRACVRGVYGLLKEADPWLADLKPGPKVALLYSRASDDGWRFYSEPQPAPWLGAAEKDVRHSAVAQKEVLYTLFRRGVPTDLYYLESATADQLAKYRAIIVPFPLAISDAQAAMLAELAERGQHIILMSECGGLDENLARRDEPALLKLLGLQAAPTPDAAIIERGNVTFLPGSFGYDIPLNRDNQQRTHSQRIQPDPLDPGPLAVLEGLLKRACGEAPWVLADFTNDRDVEATCLTNRDGERVVLAINWSSEPADVKLLLPNVRTGTLEGFSMGPDGQVRRSSVAVAGGTCSVTLQGQEACLWRTAPTP